MLYNAAKASSIGVDALIAAPAHSRQDILVTNNIRDFKSITNLQLENWLES